MSEVSELLSAAREASLQRDWIRARDALVAAAADVRLGAEDLYALGNCHWWLGALDEALPVLQGAYRAFLDDGEPRTAALVALDVGYSYALRGEAAPASGWLGRSARLLEAEQDCAEQGFLVYLAFEEAWDAGELDTATERAEQVERIGSRFAEPNLCALGVLANGRLLLRRGQVDEGMARLDEAMVAAVSDDLDPGWAGNIYCHLMLACYELADWQRAQEWTRVTAHWCEAMPGAGPFLGICRVHRAQVMQARGDWPAAEAEVMRVCEEMPGFHVGMVAEARYQLGDLRRQRGEEAGAEAAFAEAERLGRDPQPGRALLQLARGRRATAAAEIHRALAAVGSNPLTRSRLLPAAVEIATAGGDLEAARAATAELETIGEGGGGAATYGTAGLATQASRAAGAVALAEGRADEALVRLRDALSQSRRAQMPYDAALTQLSIAAALEQLDQREAAVRERAAAESELARLGAADPGSSFASHRRARADGLTPREAEVLGLLADGLTNQQIADRLVLSIRTVERHLATVYRKLGLQGRSARAAAVRYALTSGERIGSG